MAGRSTGSGAAPAFTRAHGVIIAACTVIFAFIVYAVQHYHWWMAEMGGGFLLMGLVAAAAARLSVADTARAFVKGLEEMVVAALVVGFARGIAVVLTDGKIVYGRWKRPTGDAGWGLVDETGAPIALTPGRTWVALPEVGSAATTATRKSGPNSFATLLMCAQCGRCWSTIECNGAPLTRPA